MSDSCNSIDCSLPGSSVLGISQARIPNWTAIFFSRGYSRLREKNLPYCKNNEAQILTNRLTFLTGKEGARHSKQNPLCSIGTEGPRVWEWTSMQSIGYPSHLPRFLSFKPPYATDSMVILLIVGSNFLCISEELYTAHIPISICIL